MSLGEEENQNILERQKELVEFLHELDLIRAKEGEKTMLSPIAGILEKQELDKINKILQVLGYPT